MDLNEIKAQLREIEIIHSDLEKLQAIEESIFNNKKTAVVDKNNGLSKEYWCIQQIFEANKYFLKAFNEMKDAKYYKGWCSLEKAELRIQFVSRYYDILNDEYKIKFINEQIAKFQSIFPYKVFFSTEFLEKKIQCSICDAVITPRKKCEHEVWEIYDGEMCSRRISDMELLGIAIVENPVHKYAVAFLPNETGENKDHYDYSLVKFLIGRLQSPYEPWDVQMTKRRHPHSNFNFIGRNDKCPCGSGKKYKKCCLDEAGVLMPHAKFNLLNITPDEEGQTIYPYIENSVN